MTTERRRSFRCPVLEGRRHAMLKADGVERPASLLDESAGGFCAAVVGPIPWQEGDLLELSSDAGRCRVRIVRQTVRPDHMELGLERLEDLPDPAAAAMAGLGAPAHRRGLRRGPIGGASVAVPGLIVAMVVGIGFWLASSQRPFSLSAGRESRSPHPANKSPDGERPPAPENSASSHGSPGRSLWGLRPGRAESSPAGGDGKSRAGGESSESLDQQFSRFAFLSSEKAVEPLGLSAEQQMRLQQIRQEYVRRLSNAYRDCGPQDPEFRRQSEEILQEGLRREEKVLTDEQKARWKAMSSDGRAPGEGESGDSEDSGRSEESDQSNQSGLL